MDKTFWYQQKQASTIFKSTSDVLIKYPWFVDIDDGSLLLYCCWRNELGIPNCTNDCMTALILIMRLMPAIYKVKKVGFDSKLGQFFHFIKENENISTVAQQKDLVYHKQPFLIVVGTNQHHVTYFLVVDQTAIPTFKVFLDLWEEPILRETLNGGDKIN
ncbi:hypothetical protein OUZ56_025312 [Daphnia magna]|uniref:Uncharacterized protein n=1 Tax=Daphnia magna TaxID=35525 RepID=A0ABQ9ZJG6_9CRUS|nr:hypothetical protein OUZ56_025312 [Daphnia magna]